MRITYPDGSFTEVILSKPGHVSIVIASKDQNDPLKLNVVGDEITIEQFALIIKDLGIQLPKV